MSEPGSTDRAPTRVWRPRRDAWWGRRARNVGRSFLLSAGLMIPFWIGFLHGQEDPLRGEVRAVAEQLRCPVCQNLTVADSPSEMARNMRDQIRDRLVAGESPEEIKAYFVSRYGEWILEAPPKRGFNLVAWTFPFLFLLGGAYIVWRLVRRWRRAPKPSVNLSPEELSRYRARIREEVEQE